MAWGVRKFDRAEGSAVVMLGEELYSKEGASETGEDSIAEPGESSKACCSIKSSMPSIGSPLSIFSPLLKSIIPG